MFSRINLWLSSLVVLPPPLPLNIHDDDRRCSLSSDWLRKYAHASCSILYQLCCGSVNCVRMKKYNYNYISERLSLLLLLHFLNGQITTILVWARRRHGTLYPADLSVYCVSPPTPNRITDITNAPSRSFWGCFYVGAVAHAITPNSSSGLVHGKAPVEVDKIKLSSLLLYLRTFPSTFVLAVLLELDPTALNLSGHVESNCWQIYDF